MSVHESWLNSIESYRSEVLRNTGISLQLPPPSLAELKLEYLKVEPGVTIRARLPFLRKFTNPVGLYQGGFLSAAIDEVFGPLSYLTAGRPCMTLSMNVTFIRAFEEKMAHCLVDAVVVRKTTNLIFMRADVLTQEGEMLAHAQSHVTILREEQFKRAEK
ncbi:MAG TPA: PaaI family thioesterase [Bacteriovoracaceae bacterium]|nr:PaaI family thioesterase [Bacteriovoracaceae bacterium]